MGRPRIWDEGESDPTAITRRTGLEAESVVIAQQNSGELKKLTEKTDWISAKFGEVFKSDTDFSNALLYATGRGLSTNKRIEVFQNIFKEALHA